MEGWMLGLVAAVAGTGMVSSLWRHRPLKRSIRGNAVERTTSNGSDRVKLTPSRPYLFGSQALSFADLKKNTILVGAPGSGKTVQMLLLMKTVMKRLAEDGTGVKALVYDSKSDLLSKIRAMGVPEERIIVLNALDARCWAWDLCRDVRTQAEADDVAAILMPTPEGAKDPYFSRTAQMFLAGIIEAFQASAPDNWELRDLILAGQTKERLQAVFGSSESTRDLLQHFEPEKTFKSVLSTLNGQLKSYRTIAASWSRARAAGRSFSIDDWLNGQSVLVMGNHPKAKAPIRQLNQLLFSSIAKAILSQPGEPQDETFLFIDEFRELGKLDMMADLMITARSKSTAIVLGFQDIFGVDSIYGKEQSREIIGCAANLGILHINSSQPDTQRWASEVVGDNDYVRRERGFSQTAGSRYCSSSESVSYRQINEKVWFPGLFALELPPTTFADGQRGLFRIHNRFYHAHVCGKRLFTGEGLFRVPERVADFRDHIPLSRDQLMLLPWSEADYDRLAIPGLDRAESVSMAPTSSSREVFSTPDIW